MEFDENFIRRLLEIWEFDVQEIDVDKVKYVPMHEFRISTMKQPLLYIGNLQCCIGLYAYGNSFAFAAHINTVVFDNNEYTLNEKGEPVYCNRCNDLIREILKYQGEIIEPFKIGISFGVKPLNKDEKSMSLIYDGIDQTIKRLAYLNIPVIKTSDMNESEFIIDSLNSNIIIPKRKIK